MPNIFGGLDKLSDDDIRLQIALFGSVTVGNAVKETSLKAVGMMVNFAYKFTGKSNNADKSDYQVTRVEDVVFEQIKSLKKSTRLEIDEMLRKILIEKCNSLNMNSADEASSDDLLSNLIIREAAKINSLNQYMSPASLAENVSKNYYDQFLKRLHKNLIKETSEEIKTTDNNLQQYLNRAPIDIIRNMSKRIILTELSGKGIGKLIRTETGIKNITSVVECLGLEAFDVLKTVISSVYDTVLGINRVSRAILAQLVWVSVNAYGAKFTVNIDLLPNYVPANLRQEQDVLEKEFIMHLVNRKDLDSKISNCNTDIEKLTSKLMELQVMLLEDNAEFEESKASFEALEIKKNQYENNIKSREEIKKYYADVISSKRKYDTANLNLKKRTMQISDFKIKLSLRKTEIEQYNNDFAIANENANRLIIQKSLELEMIWQAFYYRFIFDSKVYEQVVIDFSRSELLKIEEYLKEMHDSVDADAYSIKTIYLENQEDNFEYKCAICMVSSGKNAEIVYNDSNIKIIRKQ